MQISKSRYCRGIQCPKMIWMDQNMPEKAIKKARKDILENGTEVGKLAQTCFEGCKEVIFSLNGKEMAEETRELMAKGEKYIAEASFYYEDLFCSVDILRKNSDDDSYDIIEVKSSTSVSKIYAEDLAFQHYVLTKAGLKINRAYIMHINGSYERQGDLDLLRLFHMEDLTDVMDDYQKKIPDMLKVLRFALGQKEELPVPVGVYCENPYKCDYKEYCHRHITSPSVFDISGMHADKKYWFNRDGIITFQDILNHEEYKNQLTKSQLIQVETEVNNSPDVINKEKIRAFLRTLSYPLYYLDFETYQQAIPQFDGVRPYMQIPFQYSLHVQKSEGGTLEHYEFLGEAGADPRRALAEKLCRDIPLDACVLAYNMSFEKGRIKELAELYPDLSAHLMNIHDHVKDLIEPFRSRNYYSKKLKGSYSIKYVLPALCPDDEELNYENLSGVHNGGEAMTAFAQMTKMSPEEAAETRKNLLAYCRLDTLAMVRIVEKLREMVK